MQDLAWIASLAGMLIILAVFALVARGASQPAAAEAPQPPVGRIRGGLFALLALAIVLLSALTLGGLPYARPTGQGVEPLVVTVIGQQWSWEISPGRAVVGQPVEFAVTSRDVNHGFALFDDDLTLIAQTQAMPGYVNRLRHTFTTPGTYRILCLEYCGLAHHDMPAEFVVTER